jgi:hypothetical protein
MCSIAATTFLLLISAAISALYDGCNSGAIPSCATSEPQTIDVRSASSPHNRFVFTHDPPLVCICQVDYADAATHLYFGSIRFRESLQIADYFFGEFLVRKQWAAADLPWRAMCQVDWIKQ